MKKKLLNLVLLALPVMGLLAFKKAPIVNSGTMEYFLPWVIYCGDETPDAFSTTFAASNSSGTYSTTANSGIVNITTGDGADNGTGNAMWRQNFSASDPLTVVIKAKVNPDAVRNLAFSIDIDLDPERFEVQIRKYGDGDWRYNISQGYPGSGDVQNAALGINPENEWHIYRFTKTGGAGATCSLYIDENPTPLYTNTTSASGRTNTYFRFGDGWGSGTINTDFDWVVWDNTGAYSPADQALPDFSSCSFLSTQDIEKKNIWAAPIPTQDFVFVNHPELTEKTSINIYDLSGKLIKSIDGEIGTNKTQIDLTGFSKGLYIVRYQNGGHQQQFKVLKE